MIKNRTITPYYILFLFWASISVVIMAQDDHDKASKAYQQAYHYILDEDWQKAIIELDKVIKNFSSSKWVDDAKFWQCYAREKKGESPENSLKCYQVYIEDYPHSKWVDDAKSNLIRLGHKLVESGKPEYEAIIKTMEQENNEDLVISALFALQNMGDEKALSSLLEIYNNNRSYKVRKQIIFSLSQIKNPEATKQLIEIARNEGDQKLREDAIFWLGQKANSEEIVNILVDIVNNDTNIEIQKKAIFALSQSRHSSVPEQLIKIAKNNKNEEVQKQAIFWLGQKASSPEIIKALEDIVESDNNINIQDQAIFALGQAPNNQGIPVLIKIAKKHPRNEIRKKAIFWLGQSKDPRAKDALLEIINATNVE